MSLPANPWEGMSDATVITTRRVPVPEPPDPRRGFGADAAPPEAADGPSAVLVDALVVAWTMFRVYHDPRPQDAFRRAVATLGSLPSFPWTVEVHGGGFRHAGRPIPTRRQATPALARAIFARGIAVLGFSAPPTPDDLLRLFETLAFHEAPGADPQGPAAALGDVEAARLIIIEHGRLTDTPEGLEEADELVPADASGGAGSHPGDPSRRYLDEYRLLYERLQAGDFQGLQELVHGFTDSFFALPQEQQTRLFEQFLTRHEEEPFRLLLDQFSQDDLAELAHLLSPGTHPLLVEYARIAAEQEGQPAAADEMLPADQLVSDRISAMLRSGRAGLRRQVGEALRSQIPSPEANLAAGVRVASTLFALTDDAGFTRLAHTVAAKAAAACNDGDLARAARWGSALLVSAPSRERKEIVRREMEAALQPGVLDRLVTAVAEHPEPPPGVTTLVVLFALDRAVERFAAEEHEDARRSLAALLEAAARLRPGPLLRRLTDPRRRLVRDLIEILANSRRPEAVAGLRSACAHPDPDIRRGALGALSRLDREQTTAVALVALHDPEPSLRREALELLRGGLGREVDVALAAFVDSRPPREERLAAVEVLARRRTGPARVTLQRLARRRLFASGATREMGRAARRVLSGGGR
jgi:hypothetical protein